MSFQAYENIILIHTIDETYNFVLYKKDEEFDLLIYSSYFWYNIENFIFGGSNDYLYYIYYFGNDELYLIYFQYIIDDRQFIHNRFEWSDGDKIFKTYSNINFENEEDIKIPKIIEKLKKLYETDPEQSFENLIKNCMKKVEEINNLNSSK